MALYVSLIWLYYLYQTGLRTVAILLLQPPWVLSSQVCMCLSIFSLSSPSAARYMQGISETQTSFTSEISFKLFMRFWVQCFRAKCMFYCICWMIIKTPMGNTRTVSLNIIITVNISISILVESLCFTVKYTTASLCLAKL